ncbi:hypothetical protein BDR06DRAFT_117808 [Suillus hirtellus]|nr:hypothetical protein BDR06DRAFT_117808 [Suillus hirtellus]
MHMEHSLLRCIVFDAAKRGADLFIRVATPERAALFGAFPLRLKDAILSKQYDKDMMDLPYNHVRHNMVF